MCLIWTGKGMTLVMMLVMMMIKSDESKFTHTNVILASRETKQIFKRSRIFSTLMSIVTVINVFSQLITTITIMKRTRYKF